MRIILASTVMPFVLGGATLIVDWLEDELRVRGHEVETLRLPFASHYPEMPEQMLALRLLDVGTEADRFIAIRTPSYVIKHPRKVVWFIHHHRTAYDYWGTEYQEIPNTPRGLGFRDAIVEADNVSLREARALFTNSAEVSGRLLRYNGLESEVLYPPIKAPEAFRSEDYGDYVFYPSRLVHHKRQHLLIEAMQHTRTPVQLVVAGAAEGAAYASRLRELLRDPQVAKRVQLVDRWISEEEKIDFFARSLGAAYIPLLEDSYGFPSLEAHAAERSVITTNDAGGTSELIIDGVNGFITDPTPVALAAAMDRLYADRSLAAAMGRAGKARVGELGITWDHVIERLLA
jgi:glycosyltransferase involved in cell wall biosynthesis